MALGEDMLGIAMTNQHGCVGGPTFGRQVMFGTNPLPLRRPSTGNGDSCSTRPQPLSPEGGSRHVNAMGKNSLLAGVWTRLVERRQTLVPSWVIFSAEWAVAGCRWAALASS